MTSFYDLTATSIEGRSVSMSEFRGRVLLIVNVASRCSFTVQYASLEALYRKHKAEGFEILGFPCDQFLYQEPGNETQIQEFCRATYDVTFPMFAKIKVNGPDAHPIYKFLKQARGGWFGVRHIGWNFTKFLLDRNGQVVQRFSTMTTPQSIEAHVVKLLAT